MSKIPTGALWVWRLQYLATFAVAGVVLLFAPLLLIFAIFAPGHVTRLSEAGAAWAASRSAAMDEHRKRLDRLYSQESSE